MTKWMVPLGTIYLSPRNSIIHKIDSATETFDALFKQIADFGENESMMGGDFNARIGNLPGRATGEIDLPGNRDEDTHDYSDGREKDINERDRASEDNKINAQGYDFSRLLL